MLGLLMPEEVRRSFTGHAEYSTSVDPYNRETAVLALW